MKDAKFSEGFIESVKSNDCSVYVLFDSINEAYYDYLNYDKEYNKFFIIKKGDKNVGI